MAVLRRHLRQQVFEAFGCRFQDQPASFDSQLETLTNLHAGIFQRRSRDTHGGAVSPLLDFDAHIHSPLKVDTL
ncbi:MAG: hypothetical protein BGO72_16780 [Burkholderiales bacterium 70-64]|nr:MAG: hypothetical protein BGO72_16780 [Burkholderiales bacterium 70-64]